MVGVVGHRLAADVPLSIVRTLPVVSACDAWCQLGASLPVDALIAAGDRLIGWPQALATFDDIDAALRRWGSGRGAVALRTARGEVRRGSASPRETRLRLLVLRAGHPEPECNGEIRLPDGSVTHGDLVFRAQRVVLEYDGEQHRTDARQFRRDVARLNALALDGWIVIRVNRTTPTADVLAQLDRAFGGR
jgi:hypothetical protein